MEGKNKNLVLNVLDLTHLSGSGKQAVEERNLEFKAQAWTGARNVGVISRSMVASGQDHPRIRRSEEHTHIYLFKFCIFCILLFL